MNDFVNRIAKQDKVRIVVDLFGGSGLLSVACRDVLPSHVRIVYNDYDNFVGRVNAIDLTRKIQAELLGIVRDSAVNKRLSENVRKSVLSCLERYRNNSCTDWKTIASWLFYTFNTASCYEDFAKRALYNCVRKTPVAFAPDYLNGIGVVRRDWRDLMSEYKGEKGVFWLFDPPYLSTEQQSYSEYWRLDDYLDLVAALPASGFAYFGSEKSDFVKMLDWGADRLGWYNPFAGCERVWRVGSRAGGLVYNEFMLFKGL